MRIFICFAGYFLLAISLAGCGSLPPLKNVGGNSTNQPNPPAVSDIMKHIECEIVLAMNDRNDPDIRAFLEYDYVLYVSLTLDETSNEGFNPSLSYIWPRNTAGLNSEVQANGELSGQQHRNFVQNFTIDLDQAVLKNSATLAQCTPLNEQTFGIRGTLGIEQVIKEGARHRAPDKYVFPVLGDESNLTQQQKDAVGTINGQLLPTFASTIDFTLVYGLTGGGPNWTLTHFLGPGGTSGLVNYSRTNKNTLVLSFASSQKHVNLISGSEEPNALIARKAMAGQAAQAAATRLILQQLHVIP